MRWFRRRGRLILFSVSHAFLLVVLTFYWMNLSLEFADDVAKVARVNQIVQYLLLDKDDPLTETIKKKLILINCSYDKMLVPFEDDHGTGTRAVINRQLLSDMLKTIRPSKPEMVIMDIFFDNPSPVDSILYAGLWQTSPLIMSSYMNADGSMNRPRKGLPYARAQYETTIGSFLKYRILDNDSIKYVPALMYELTTGDTLSRMGAFVNSDQAWWLNSFIVDLSIRKSHIENNEVVMWNLGEILRYSSPEEIQSLTKGKIIVFGDFYEFDNHETLLGVQPGPLIIVNTYLGLLKGAPKITFWLVFMVFSLYLACTVYILRFKSSFKQALTNKIFQGKVMKFIIQYFSYIVIFSLYTVLLYVLTGKHFELLVFAIYFNVFEFVITKFKGKIDRFLTIG